LVSIQGRKGGERKGRNKEGRGEMSMGFSFICWTHISTAHEAYVVVITVVHNFIGIFAVVSII